jgi:hypothetical protein
MKSPPQVPPPTLFDRPRIARRYAYRQAAGADFVTRLVIEEMHERLAAVQRRFEKALIIGPDASLLPAGSESGIGTIAFQRHPALALAPGMMVFAPDHPALPGTGYDLVVSLLELQIVDDVAAYLRTIRLAMRPDGLFMAALPGGDTLKELRQAWLEAETALFDGAQPRTAPMIEIRDAGALLHHAGFALPVCDTDTHKVRYPDAMALVRELHAMGASNPLVGSGGGLVSRRLLAAANAAYQRLAGNADGRVSATLDIVWMSGWVPDTSQQKPLRPGSARTRLSDVLKDKSRP